jgi:hypothetical protein
VARNPAHEFLNYFEAWEGIEIRTLIETYTLYLLSRSDAYALPVDLEKVFRHYGLNIHKIKLIGQRGAVTPDLQILVNSSDSRQVQKYSLAHELIEIFVAALVDYDPQWLTEKHIKDLLDRKEHWCELAAADIVMPMELFKPLVLEAGFSINSAKVIAQVCEVSLFATLRRIIETGIRQAALVIWRYGHKPSEFVPSAIGQMNLWNEATYMDPPKKLRVEQVYKSPSLDQHIRKHKSIEMETAIGRAFSAATNNIFSGYDYIEIISKAGRYWTEAISVNYGNEPRVMSLIYFDRPLE